MTDDRRMHLDGFQEWWQGRYGWPVRDAAESGDPAVFAAMAAWDAAVLAERERCAKVAEATEAEGVYRQGEDGGSVWDSDAEATKAEIARRIRRGPEPTEGV